MRTEKVVISHPKRDAVNGSTAGGVSTGTPVGFAKGTVQSFDALFKGTKLFGHGIAIGETNDLSNKNIPVLMEFELLCGERVGAVAIRDETEGFPGEMFKFFKSHPHGKDAGPNIPGRRNLISQDRTGDFIHDEPDISFLSPDFDISFIGSQFLGGLIIVGIHEGSDDDGSGFRIVVDHGV